MSLLGNSQLIPPRFLFRFSVPMHKLPLGGVKSIAKLDASFGLPVLSSLDGRRGFAEVRAGWHESGLAFLLRLKGKTQFPWCREGRSEDSDGLQLWISTRDTSDIHRATRHCHRFALLPMGAGRKRDQPFAEQLLIHRARENANPLQPNRIHVQCAVKEDGYTMAAFLPADVLTGFDPNEQRQLGFQYLVIDRELGLQSLAPHEGLPTQEDPSLWAVADMVD